MSVEIYLTDIPKYLKTNRGYDYLEIKVSPENKTISAEDFKTIEIPQINQPILLDPLGLVIGGNAPTWLYLAVFTEILFTINQKEDYTFNDLEWAALFDPAIGATVFWTNTEREIYHGEVIPCYE